MKAAIMQPYFLPYIGYWQLMYAADVFVVYDDVNYRKGGFINRNRLLENGAPAYFNINIVGASQNKLINQTDRLKDDRLTGKLLRRIVTCYKKAPCFEETYPVMEKIITYEETNLAQYLFTALKCMADYLGIDTQIILSSDMEKDNTLKGQDKVLDICRQLGADTYYNAIGGRKLYNREDFHRAGIELFFIETEEIIYPQFENAFVPGLSILDVLMFNGVEKTKQYLERYRLV